MGDVPVVVSACLLGLACRYDGRAEARPALVGAMRGRSVLPVCPETAAGLGVPRPPFALAHPDAERVLDEARGLPNRDGVDVAPRLVPACRALARRALRLGVREAVLKERSPSCGVHAIHVRGHLVVGCGVFSAELRRRGITLRSDEDLEEPGAGP